MYVAGFERGERPIGSLIDLHDFVDDLATLDAAEFPRLFHRAIQLLRQRAIKDIVDQRGFSRTGNARHRRQPSPAVSARRDPADCWPRSPAASASCRWECGAAPAPESRAAPLECPPVSDAGFAAISARPARWPPVARHIARSWPPVHDEIGAPNRLFVVLDHDHRVPRSRSTVFRPGSDENVVVRVRASRSKARPAHTARRANARPICVAKRMRCASPPESVAARAVQAPDSRAPPPAKNRASKEISTRDAQRSRSWRAGEPRAHAIPALPALSSRRQRRRATAMENQEVFRGQALRPQAAPAMPRKSRRHQYCVSHSRYLSGTGLVQVASRGSLPPCSPTPALPPVRDLETRPRRHLVAAQGFARSPRH